MNNLRFQAWIRRAVSRIVLTQDRIRAGRELLDHMEDNYQDHLDRGMEPRDAEAQTIAAMGDAETVAWQLGTIHRPFWGYCQKYSHRILVVIASLALVCLCGRIIAGLFFTDGYEQPAYVRTTPTGTPAPMTASASWTAPSIPSPGTPSPPTATS